MASNNAQQNRQITMLRDDGVTPFGLLGLTLELWIRPWVAGPVLVKLSSDNVAPASRIEILSDSDYLFVVSRDDMQMLAPQFYLLDVLDMTDPDEPQYLGGFQWEVEQGITESSP